LKSYLVLDKEEERMHTRTAIITGGSRGLGLALGEHLASLGWNLVVDGRNAARLANAAAGLQAATTATIVAIPGDVADPAHCAALVGAADRLGGCELLVNNASTLGASPLPTLAEYPIDDLRRAFDVNVAGPLQLIQLALPALREGGTVLNITSDAATEAYQGWGGYGSSKAALEQLSNVLAAEEPDVRVLWVDPGDMNTWMHQEAFPGEDISDRPPPEERVPGIARILEAGVPGGRYRAGDFLVPAGAPA
jgi:NAD(P)-dependent dehydrogenase (short-subunit alcohol dehydrogenase family)